MGILNPRLTFFQILVNLQYGKHNWDAEYMIIGQDWGPVEYASQAPFIPGDFDPTNPTDILLNKAVSNAQIETNYHVTNSTICLRQGSN